MAENYRAGETHRETLNEYLTTYEYLENRLETFDRRIGELASEMEYVEEVKKLVCFLGVKTHTALSCLFETGDFQRFAKGDVYSAYLGLVPGGRFEQRQHQQAVNHKSREQSPEETTD